MEIDAYRGLEPTALWRHFATLNAIPRPSGHEAQAREYVVSVAEAAGVPYEIDARGNTIVRVPASTNGEAPVIAVQAHLDMVCESDSDVAHDCERDPIVPRREGDLIFASGTTLGADNGVGVAACLALLDVPRLRHGGIELIFTVDEERGPWGAHDLDMSRLRAEVLLNLDSEDADALTIGSAGGCDVDVVVPLAREATASAAVGARLDVSGLRGGHSGIQIDEPRANAVKLLAELLSGLRDAGVPLGISTIEGGSAHNAIPRSASASLAFVADQSVTIRRLVEDHAERLSDQWGANEPGLTIALVQAPAPGSVIVDAVTGRLLELLRELPHGVLAMSARLDTVETSANLAGLVTDESRAKILTSLRSLATAPLREVEDRIRELARHSAAAVEVNDGYPAWEPREHSPVLEAAIAAYRRTYGKDPRLDVLHGGLECGAIVAKKPSLDAVSFGPLIRDAHTPMEHVYASTVTTTWALLLTLIAELAG
jgi:dipeptidase D